ncbi:MAG: hypothetical protein V3U98_00415 [Acidobacteriota bacterium]
MTKPSGPVERSQEQREAFKRELRRRQRRQKLFGLLFLLGLFAICVVAWRSPGGFSRGHVEAAVLLLLAGWLIAFLHWRCPACNGYLGRSVEIERCPRCKIELR